MTSKFLHHIPCPKCGSRDNCGEYSDHYYCFGCRFYKTKDDLKSLRSRVADRGRSTEIDTVVQDIKVDSDIPPEARRWLYSYGITKEDIHNYGIGWNESQALLVLHKQKDYWQGRTFNPHARTKYMSMGKKPLLLYGKSDTIVLVEDIISAIRISEVATGMPLLGVSMSQQTIDKIVENFNRAVVWLDRDKATLAIKHKRALEMRGIDASVVISPKDPKEYTKGELSEWLNLKS